MAYLEYLYKYELTAAGGTIALSATDNTDEYLLFSTGGVTILASWNVACASTVFGRTIKIRYVARCTPNTSPVFPIIIPTEKVVIMGYTMNIYQMLCDGYFDCVYDGSSWQVHYTSESSANNVISTDNIGDKAVTLAKITDLTRGSILTGQTASNRPAELTMTANHILARDASDIVNAAVAGDLSLAVAGGNATFTIINKAVTLAKMDDLTLGYILQGDGTNRPFPLYIGTANSIMVGNGTNSISVLMNGEVDIQLLVPGFVTATVLTTELITATASFETNEVGDFKIRMPFKGTVNHCSATVKKTVAGTDDGYVSVLNEAGVVMTGTPLTIAASSVLNTTVEASVTANNTFVAGDHLTIRTAKVTAGGRVQVSIACLRTV